MRINGRTLRASTPTERRLLRALGTDALHVPRRENPFRVARQLEQLARKIDDEMFILGKRLKNNTKHGEPQPSPDVDLPYPQREDQDALCA